MPTLKCTKDETGYWTVGETYAAGYAGGGILSVGDDSDPEADWLAHPKDWKDGDDEDALIYHMPGCFGEVEFVEVN